jgi:tetratricopeptide (TPR) repeat protein
VKRKSVWDSAVEAAEKVSHSAKLPVQADLLRRAHNTLGNLFLVANEFEKSLHHLTISYDLTKTFKLKPSAINNIGECYRMQGKYEEAKKYYEQFLNWCINAHDKHAQSTAFTNLGHVELAQNNFLKAAEYFDKSIELSGKYGFKVIESPIMKGEALYLLSKYQEAFIIWNDVLTMNNIKLSSNKNEEILFKIGEIFWSKGERKLSGWFFRKILETDSNLEWHEIANEKLKKIMNKSELLG